MLHLKGQVRSVQPKEVGPSVVRAYIFFFFQRNWQSGILYEIFYPLFMYFGLHFYPLMVDGYQFFQAPRGQIKHMYRYDLGPGLPSA